MKAPRVVAVICLTSFVAFAEPALSDWQKVTGDNGETAAIDTETIAPGPSSLPGSVSATICRGGNGEGKCQTSRVIFNCHGRMYLPIAIFGVDTPPGSLPGELAAIACAKR